MRELSRLCDVETYKNCTIVTIVAHGIGSILATLTPLFDQKVLLVTKSASDVSVSMAIRDSDNIQTLCHEVCSCLARTLALVLVLCSKPLLSCFLANSVNGSLCSVMLPIIRTFLVPHLSSFKCVFLVLPLLPHSSLYTL